MIPSVDRIVHIRLSKGCALNITSSRQNNKKVFHGNSVQENDIYPMIITRVWDKELTDNSLVQRQVILDGNDTHWVTSVQQGTKNGQWFSPVGE